MLAKNIWNGRYVVASFLGVFSIFYYVNMDHMVRYDVFGYDGNGGDMLKILTVLSDEEMARLKYMRRTSWHWPGSRRSMQGNYNPIQD